MAYIPEKHQKYGLLPRCRETGREVFDYPHLLNVIEQAMQVNLTPYGYNSYEEYYGYLEELKEEHPGFAEPLDDLIDAMKELNTKENWSVLRYTGENFGDILGGLTHGRAYYWPCSANAPVYSGVVDDEEFTSFVYATDADLWEILDDPTGMAYRTIYCGKEKNR